MLSWFPAPEIHKSAYDEIHDTEAAMFCVSVRANPFRVERFRNAK